MDNVCCICGASSEHLIQIEESLSNEPTYLEKLRDCIPEINWFEDYQLCQQCANRITDIYDFREVCLNTTTLQLDYSLNNSYDESTNDLFHLPEIKSEEEYPQEDGTCQNHDAEPKEEDEEEEVEIGAFETQHSEEEAFENEGMEAIAEETEEEVLEAADPEPQENQSANNKQDTVESERSQETAAPVFFTLGEAKLNTKPLYTIPEGYDRDILNYGESDFIGECGFLDERGNTSVIIENENQGCTDVILCKGKRKISRACGSSEIITNKNQGGSHIISSKGESKMTCACGSTTDVTENKNYNSQGHCNKKVQCAFRLELNMNKASNGMVIEEQKKKTKIKGPVTCEYCGRDFKRKEHLSAHIRSKHTLEKPYCCSACGSKFALSQSFIVHKRTHSNERPYCCTYCGKQFTCSANLYHHNQIHLNKRDYKCDICEKCFNTASILRRHKICVHTDPELWKYVCCHCGKRFPMSGNLKTHLRRHDNEKNFKCEICLKSFYDKFILQRHMRCHSDERLFKCRECDKEYKDNCTLNIHLKKVHDIGNATLPNRVKNFVCHICPSQFINDEKLQKHINLHEGLKPFDCDLCQRKFSDNRYKKKHMEKQHKFEGFRILGI